MRTVFADTFYWISFFNPNDVWYNQVRTVTRSLEPLRIVTTEDVLSEVLTFYANSGLRMRQRTVELVKGIMTSDNIQVIKQSHELFLLGLDLYERRLDKGYSLPDCISMNVMKQLNIDEVLTHDKHFAQEGFSILFKSLEN
jgi:predicted nucleic acid-binding protein